MVDTDLPAEEEHFRDLTKRTIIHDRQDGEPAEVTLAEAIDLVTGCNWDFQETVRTILAAIGGRLDAERPVALHARNLKSSPIRERMRAVSSTLLEFCEPRGSEEADPAVLHALGQRTPVKEWLVASLDKTLRLQLDF